MTMPRIAQAASADGLRDDNRQWNRVVGWMGTWTKKVWRGWGVFDLKNWERLRNVGSLKGWREVLFELVNR